MNVPNLYGRRNFLSSMSGGFAGVGAPLPPLPIQVLWGSNDRILRAPQRRAAQQLLGDPGEELQACGHLPHLDQAALVAQRWRGQ